MKPMGDISAEAEQMVAEAANRQRYTSGYGADTYIPSGFTQRQMPAAIEYLKNKYNMAQNLYQQIMSQLPNLTKGIELKENTTYLPPNREGTSYGPPVTGVVKMDKGGAVVVPGQGITRNPEPLIVPGNAIGVTPWTGAVSGMQSAKEGEITFNPLSGARVSGATPQPKAGTEPQLKAADNQLIAAWMPLIQKAIAANPKSPAASAYNMAIMNKDVMGAMQSAAPLLDPKNQQKWLADLALIKKSIAGTPVAPANVSYPSAVPTR